MEESEVRKRKEEREREREEEVKRSGNGKCGKRVNGRKWMDAPRMHGVCTTNARRMHLPRITMYRGTLRGTSCPSRHVPHCPHVLCMYSTLPACTRSCPDSLHLPRQACSFVSLPNVGVAASAMTQSSPPLFSHTSPPTALPAAISSGQVRPRRTIVACTMDVCMAIRI